MPSQSQALGLDRTGHSPRVQQKIVYGGVHSTSYQQASRDLAELSDLAVTPKQVERLVQRIGQERIDQRNAAVAAHAARPLMEQDTLAERERPCPAVALVSVDGGRLQVRAEPSEGSPEPSEGSPEPSEAARRSLWRESKVAVLETHLGAMSDGDPDPHVPRCFLDWKRTAEIVRGLSHPLPTGLQWEAPDRATDTAEATTGRDRAARPGRPERLVRSVLASRAGSDAFGPMVHQAADARNFFGATRRVFLGDGLPANGTLRGAISPASPRFWTSCLL